MNNEKLTIIDHKNRTAVVSFYDLLQSLLDNFDYDIDVIDIEARVDGAGFMIDSYDAEIWGLSESMDDALANALEDIYSNDKFNPKAKQ